jgi:hypothetical protein
MYFDYVRSTTKRKGSDLIMKLSQENKQQVESCSVLLVCLAYSYTLKMEAVCSSEASINHQATNITSQKIVFFIVTAVRISNPESCNV